MHDPKIIQECSILDPSQPYFFLNYVLYYTNLAKLSYVWINKLFVILIIFLTSSVNGNVPASIMIIISVTPLGR